MSDVIEIPLSKTKMMLGLIGSAIFILLGIVFIYNPDIFVSPIIHTPELIRLLGIGAILFFGSCFIFIIRKLFDKNFGLRIDENGITDNSSATSVGLIEWDDIQEIRKMKIASTKMLLLMTDKPEKYIERAKNYISKKGLKANQKMYGSPLIIASVSLKTNFDDLENIITMEHKKKRM